jgi:hypothetical protein
MVVASTIRESPDMVEGRKGIVSCMRPNLSPIISYPRDRAKKLALKSVQSIVLKLNQLFGRQIRIRKIRKSRDDSQIHNLWQDILFSRVSIRNTDMHFVRMAHLHVPPLKNIMHFSQRRTSYHIFHILRDWQPRQSKKSPIIKFTFPATFQ